MHTWFECKVTFERVAEEGLMKKVTEPYVVDAVSFTEAETRILKEVEAYASGELMVSNIRRAKIAELFFNEGGDKWYRCKVNYIMLDEEKGIEKKSAQTMMVQANDLPNAIQILTERMEGSLGDYEISAITETAILDVFSYEPQN